MRGLPYDTVNPSVTMNAYLGLFVMLFSRQGDPQTLYISFSQDGVQEWSAPAVLLRVNAPSTIAFPSLIGATNSTVTGKLATLVYASSPPSGAQPVDFVARSLTFE